MRNIRFTLEEKLAVIPFAAFGAILLLSGCAPAEPLPAETVTATATETVTEQPEPAPTVTETVTAEPPPAPPAEEIDADRAIKVLAMTQVVNESPDKADLCEGYDTLGAALTTQFVNDGVTDGDFYTEDIIVEVFEAVC